MNIGTNKTRLAAALVACDIIPYVQTRKEPLALFAGDAGFSEPVSEIYEFRNYSDHTEYAPRIPRFRRVFRGMPPQTTASREYYLERARLKRARRGLSKFPLRNS